MENLTAEQKHKALFVNLIITFQQAAFQHMGKLPNPMTGKVERDINQARLAIDMLDMLKVRTKGNLPEDEAQIFDHILRELKLNFVDELDKEKKAAEGQAAQAKTEAPPNTDNVATQVIDADSKS